MANLNRGFKFEVSPTPQQVKVLDHWMEISREAWNGMVWAYRRMGWEREEQKVLVMAAHDEDFRDLNQVRRLVFTMNWQFDWIKPNLPDHTPIKEQRGWTPGVKVTLPSGEILVVEPRLKFSGKAQEQEARAKVANDLVQKLKSSTNLKELATTEFQRRKASYVDPYPANTSNEKSRLRREEELKSDNPYPYPDSERCRKMVRAKWVVLQVENPHFRLNSEAKKNPHEEAIGYPSEITDQVSKNLGKTIDRIRKGTGGQPQIHEPEKSGSCTISPSFTLTRHGIFVRGFQKDVDQELRLTRHRDRSRYDRIPYGDYKYQ